MTVTDPETPGIISTSISYYGWWDGLQSEFIIDYEK